MEIQAYLIRIQVQVSQAMLEWFDGASLQTIEGTDSILILPTSDQAALFGILLRLRDLGIPLISVTPLEKSEP